MAFSVHAHRRDGEAHAGVHARRRDVVDVAPEETRRIAERRVTQAVEIQIVLTITFVEDAETRAHRRTPAARHVPGDAHARRQTDFALDRSLWQPRRVLFDHAVEEITA